eukprot:1155599-Pelagomonas_calceolata.AAC.1
MHEMIFFAVVTAAAAAAAAAAAECMHIKWLESPAACSQEAASTPCAIPPKRLAKPGQEKSTEDMTEI